MDREDLTYWIRDGASILGQSGNTMHADFIREAADLIDQQAARIAELEADAAKAQEVQEEVYRIGHKHGWIAGRDAAAAELEVNWGHIVTPECRDAIRALTPPEDKP